MYIGNRVLYSFPKAPRDIGVKKDAVGPGQYNPKVDFIKKNTPAWSMGSSSRSHYKHNQSPGPGQYTIQNKSKTLLGTIGKQKRNRSTKGDNVGPGQYNIKSQFENDIRKNKGTSLYGRNKNDGVKNFVPGPGQYNQVGEIQQNLKHQRGFSVPHAKRGSVHKGHKMPGPGTYNSKIQTKKTKYGVFGTSKREVEKTKFENVGPGSYQNPFEMSKNVGNFTMKGRHQINNRNNQSVGPGSYNPNDGFIKKNLPKWGFGTSKRNGQIHRQKYKQTVGPGSYQTEGKNKFFKGGKFGKDKRDKGHSKFEIPGPGQYKTNTTTMDLKNNAGVSLKFTGKNKSKKNKEIGPGQYSPKYDFTTKRPQSCKIGTSKRKGYHNNGVPGCGTYNPEKKFKNQPNCVFGKDQRRNFKDKKLPGPGTYKDPNKWVNKSNWTMKGRHKKKNGSFNVGPGQYTPQYKVLSNVKNHGGYGFGSSQRSTYKHNNFPGPNTYKDEMGTTHKEKKGVVFGKEARKGGKKENMPGPGSYKPYDQFSEGINKNKGTSMYSRNKEMGRDCFPGPGKYNLDKEISKNSYTNSKFKNLNNTKIGTEKRFFKKRNSQSVGPGQYNLEKPLSYQTSKSKGVKFGKRNRFSMKKNDQLGPGMYNIQSRFNMIPNYVKTMVNYEFKTNT